MTVDKIEPQVDALYGQVRILPEWRERVRSALRDDARTDLRSRDQEAPAKSDVWRG